MPTPAADGGESGAGQARAAATYGAAAEHFDDAPLSFWRRFGERTVQRLDPAPGASVLDVCCGSGASALAAAHRVGPSGRVLGIDLAEGLLDLGRAKAAEEGVAEVAEFRVGDAAALDDLPAASFDAVVCVFGIFFIPDMLGALRGLRRLLAPGGRLALTTWGPRIFEPAPTAFWDAVAAERSDLVRAYQPWDRLTDEAVVARLMRDAGLRGVAVELEPGTHPLSSPDDWWTIVLGSGYRAPIDELDEPAGARVRDRCLRRLRDDRVREIEVNVIYGVGGAG